uniref:Uncharacterized protein n=1 Tax=Anguilla anguilla TaxID=7936 RepID=A0A0E9TER6_ANGAN
MRFFLRFLQKNINTILQQFCCLHTTVVWLGCTACCSGRGRQAESARERQAESARSSCLFLPAWHMHR